jgi:hypothetical protein
MQIYIIYKGIISLKLWGIILITRGNDPKSTSMIHNSLNMFLASYSNFVANKLALHPEHGKFDAISKWTVSKFSNIYYTSPNFT